MPTPPPSDMGKRIKSLSTPWFVIHYDWLAFLLFVAFSLVTLLILLVTSHFDISVDIFNIVYQQVLSLDEQTISTLRWSVAIAIIVIILGIFIAHRKYPWKQNGVGDRIYSFLVELVVGPIWLVSVGLARLLNWFFGSFLQSVLQLESVAHRNRLKENPDEQDDEYSLAVKHLLGSFLTFGVIGKYFSWEHGHLVIARIPGEQPNLEKLIRTASHGVDLVAHEEFRQPLFNASFQFLSILSLTIGLFALFLVRDDEHLKKRRQERAVFSITLYAFLVYDDYVPLVLAMAIAAIYVAAEHYGSLHSAIHQIVSSVKDLKAIKDSLKEIGEVVLPDKDWRKKMYVEGPISTSKKGEIKGASYATAKRRISGVIHYFNIDDNYSSLTDLPDDIVERSRQRLQRYLKERVSLWGSFATACEGSVIHDQVPVAKMALAHRSRTPKISPIPRERSLTGLKIRMVADAPIPSVDSPLFEPEHAKSFIGLLWQLMIFGLVNALFARRHADGLDTTHPVGPWDLERDIGSRVAQIRIGYSPIWVHVVDDSAWQLFQSNAETGAKVRSITLEDQGLEEILAQAECYAKLIDADYGRAGAAEAYVSTCLRSMLDCPPEYPSDSLFGNPEIIGGILGLTGDDDFQVVAQDVLASYLACVVLTRGGAPNVATFDEAVAYVCLLTFVEVQEIIQTAPSRLSLSKAQFILYLKNERSVLAQP